MQEINKIFIATRELQNFAQNRVINYLKNEQKHYSIRVQVLYR